MVGEIRDKPTAEMAIKAAHTGHLVLSTLHTNSAEDTYSRLRQLGIDEYFMKTCIKLIIAQRLVRLLCPRCKTQKQKTETVILSSGKTHQLTPWQANGCDHCFSGYYGRTACFAFLTPQHTMSSSAGELPGSLFDAGIALAESGVTTLNEIYHMQDI